MNDLQLKVAGTKALQVIQQISAASPLGHATRAQVAKALSMSWIDTLDVLKYLRDNGNVTIGQTINDYWVKI